MSNNKCKYRKILKSKEGQKLEFIAQVSCISIKRLDNGRIKKYIALKNVKFKENEIYICDHLWISLNKRMKPCAKELTKSRNIIISFSAKVKKYKKGYFGEHAARRKQHTFSTDYKLINPCNVKIISKEKKDSNVSQAEVTHIKAILHGTKKDIQWAQMIRNNMLEELGYTYINNVRFFKKANHTQQLEQYLEKYNKCKDKLTKINKASWFIENKDLTGSELMLISV